MPFVFSSETNVHRSHGCMNLPDWWGFGQNIHPQKPPSAEGERRQEMVLYTSCCCTASGVSGCATGCTFRVDVRRFGFKSWSSILLEQSITTKRWRIWRAEVVGEILNVKLSPTVTLCRRVHGGVPSRVYSPFPASLVHGSLSPYDGKNHIHPHNISDQQRAHCVHRV